MISFVGAKLYIAFVYGLWFLYTIRCKRCQSQNQKSPVFTSGSKGKQTETILNLELRNRCSTAELHWLCQSERAAVNQTKRSGENSRPKSLSSHFLWFHSEKNEIGSKSIRPLVPRWRAAVAGPLRRVLGVWPTPCGFPLMSKTVHTRVKLYAASPLDAPAVKIPMRFQAVPLSQ